MLQLQIQAESHIPFYIQLRDQLRALVHSGELRVGDRIPASRELAVQLGVHRTTVANAYAELESEGLIEGHVGRGTFICQMPGEQQLPATMRPIHSNNGGGGPLRWEALFADERGEEGLSRLTPEVPAGAIAFVTARPSDDCLPVEEIRRCASVVLRREGRKILQLGYSDGYEPLKQALVELLSGEGVAAKENQILITNGCQQSLDLLCKAFLRPGDAVAMENPCYPGAAAIFAAAGVRCLAVPVEVSASRTGRVGVDADAVESILLQNRVKLILLTPDFHNPTGTTLPVAERRRLLEIAARHQVPIVEDHIYARLRERGSAVPSLKALDRWGIVIQIDSFSKVAFPGLRVGWCLGPENAIERLRLVKQLTDLHSDQLSQAAVAEFLKRGIFTRHLTKKRAVYASRLQALEHALIKSLPDEVEWVRPDGGMCVWLTLPAGMDAGDLLIHARERGVLYIPGRYFYFQNPKVNTLRLGFAPLDERQIARGIGILGQVIREELGKRWRGNRRLETGRVALV